MEKPRGRWDGNPSDTKSACFVANGIGDPDAGLELSAINEWKAKFARTSKRIARLVLKRKDAPEKSIVWAKRILKIESE